MAFDVLRQTLARDFLRKQEEKLPSTMAQTEFYKNRNESLVEKLRQLRETREQKQAYQLAVADLFDMVEKAGSLPLPPEEELEPLEKEALKENPDTARQMINVRRLLKNTNVPETIFTYGDEDAKRMMSQFYPELAAESPGVRISQINAEAKAQDAISKMAYLQEQGRQQRLTNWARISQEAVRDSFQAELDVWKKQSESLIFTPEQKAYVFRNIDEITDDLAKARGGTEWFGLFDDKERAKWRAELEKARNEGNISKYIDIINEATGTIDLEIPERPPELGGGAKEAPSKQKTDKQLRQEAIKYLEDNKLPVTDANIKYYLENK